MHRSRLIVPLLLLLTACEHDVYTVRMTPSDHGFQRTLQVVRQESNGNTKTPPREVLDPISSLYGIDARAANTRFAAAFGPDTPDDVGGRGRLDRVESSLGASFLYLERFRGDDDLSARVERVQDAAAVLAATGADWLDHALAGERSYKSAAADIRERLGHDARNLALLAWLAKNANRHANDGPEAQDGEDLTGAIVMYLFEHGYITADPLAAAAVSIDDDQSLPRLIVEWLAREIHADPDNPPDSLRTISTSAGMTESWDAFLAAQGPAAERLHAWARQTGVPAEDGDLQALLGHVFTIATGTEPSEGGAEDQVDLRLACPVEPFKTNGAWSEGEREIAWHFTIEPSADTPYLVPAIAFAAWAEPDEASQTAHLGAVVLKGQNLAAYCAWRSRLAESEGRRWDAFVASLDGTDLTRKLGRYEPGQDPAWSADRTGRSILFDALVE